MLLEADETGRGSMADITGEEGLRATAIEVCTDARSGYRDILVIMLNQTR